MSYSGSKSGALGLLLLGALGMLALEGAIWGGWKLLHQEAEPPQEKIVAAPQPSQPILPVEEPVDTPEAELPDVAEVTAGAVVDGQEAASSEAEQPDTAKTAAPEDRTPEEILADKARESIEQRAREAEEEAEQAEAERTFWVAHFDGYKKSMMEMIDGYFERPMDERLDHIMEFNKKLMKQIMEDRKAVGMPAEIKNPQRVNQQFMQLLGERMNNEEKKQFKAYISDVIKMQRAMIDAHLGPSPEKQPPDFGLEPEGEVESPPE